MQTRNELLERQCEKLIGELREAKSDNDAFIDELRKSKEFNDTLAAELKISRTQNENLITELRETRKELQTAINGIETMKNQMAMMMTTPQPSQTFPLSVNDDGSIQFVIHDVIGHDGKSKKKSVDQLYALVPQGLIRGGRPGVTDEIVKQAVEAFKKKK
jgi:seryl-tRNA synthetase